MLAGWAGVCLAQKAVGKGVWDSLILEYQCHRVMLCLAGKSIRLLM